MRVRLGKKRQVTIGLLVLVAMIVAISLVLSAPQHGTPAKIATSEAKKLVRSQPKPLPATSVDQQFFTLTLPVGYNPQAPGQPSGNILYSQTIIKPSAFGSVLISIGIQKLPDGGIDADPSYHLRTVQSDRYKISRVAVNGETVMFANDAQSAVVVAFWAHGQYLATISTSQGIGNPAADDNAAITAILQKLLTGWTWK